MIIVADSGSTKTDVAIVAGGRTIDRLSLPGINPVHQSEEEIKDILRNVRATTRVRPYNRGTAAEATFNFDSASLRRPSTMSNVQLSTFNFYGAGCSGSHIPMMRRLIAQAVGISEERVVVDSDMVGAVLSLYGMERGVACILGTGANSCLCDKGKVVQNIPPLGYILGDEGSGAVLGRLFLNALYKGRLQRDTCEAFNTWSGLSYEDVIDRVYRRPMANRFLASLSPFIAEHIDSDPAISEIVEDNFRAFFRNNISRYEGAREIRAVGSIAWYYREQLAAVAIEEGYVLGRVLRSPLDGLVEFLQ